MIPPAEHIAQLRALSSELQELNKQLVTGTFVRARDYFGNMAILFLQKQADHIAAAFRLEDHSDVQLIARAMVEGIGQLFWAALPSPPGQPARPLLWEKYEWVTLRRAIEEADKAKEKVNPVVRRRTNYHVRRYGSWYPERRNPPRPGRYRNEWYPISLRGMFMEIDQEWVRQGLVAGSINPADTFYQMFYRPYSSWQHWSPESVRGKTVPDGDAAARYVSSAPEESAQALYLAFMCLLMTALVVDQHFKKGREQELNNLYTRYSTWRDAART